MSKLPLRFLSYFLKNSLTQKINGFTLIELLIAISIIAILSTVGFTVYTQGQILARDAKRKADLKQIQTALNLYYQDFKSYPNTLGNNCSANAGGFTVCTSTASPSAQQPWINGVTTNYIDVLPVDPLSNSGDPVPRTGSNFGYGYRVYGAFCNKGANQIYVLYAKLENGSDPDRLAAKNYLWCNDNLPLTGTTHNWHDNLYVLSSYF